MSHFLTERLSHILALTEDVDQTRNEIIESLGKISSLFGTVGILHDALISHQEVHGLQHHCRLWSILVFYLERLPRKLALTELCIQLRREAQPPVLSALFRQDARRTFWPHKKIRFLRAAYRARQREIIKEKPGNHD